MKFKIVILSFLAVPLLASNAPKSKRLKLLQENSCVRNPVGSLSYIQTLLRCGYCCVGKCTPLCVNGAKPFCNVDCSDENFRQSACGYLCCDVVETSKVCKVTLKYTVLVTYSQIQQFSDKNTVDGSVPGKWFEVKLDSEGLPDVTDVDLAGMESNLNQALLNLIADDKAATKQTLSKDNASH